MLKWIFPENPSMDESDSILRLDLLVSLALM